MKRMIQALAFMHRGHIGMGKTEDELWHAAHKSMGSANHFAMMCDNEHKRARVFAAFEKFSGDCAESAYMRRRFLDMEACPIELKKNGAECTTA